MAVGVLGMAADLLSKHFVFQNLLDDPAIHSRVREGFLTTPTPPEQKTQQYSRYVLQQLQLHRRVCLGLNLRLSTNPGVVFGFDYIPRWAVNSITAGMIVFIIVFFAKSPGGAHWLHVALGLILGGAAGNLYDRLFSKVSLPNLTPIRYHVRDFVDCSDIGYKYIFNLADAWLVVGVVMVLIFWFRTERKTAKGKKTASRV